MILSSTSLIALLKEFSIQNNIDVVYREFSEPPTADRYMVWLDLGDTPFPADNIAYQSMPDFAVECYAVGERDFALEKDLEDFFNTNKVYWRRLEPTYVDGAHMTVYYV